MYTLYGGMLLPEALNLENYLFKYMPYKASATKKLKTTEAADISAYSLTLPSAERGKALFNSTTQGCSKCHSGTDAFSMASLGAPADGEFPAGNAYDPLIEGPSYAMLAKYIVTKMPQTNTAKKTKFGTCDQACANDIAKYIWTTFP
jgi:hypothetical protein